LGQSPARPPPYALPTPWHFPKAELSIRCMRIIQAGSRSSWSRVAPQRHLFLFSVDRRPHNTSLGSCATMAILPITDIRLSIHFSRSLPRYDVKGNVNYMLLGLNKSELQVWFTLLLEEIFRRLHDKCDSFPPSIFCRAATATKNGTLDSVDAHE
jgi:hypothetical protein